MNAQVIETDTATVILIPKLPPQIIRDSAGQPAGVVTDQRKTVVTSISLPPHILAMGEKRAREENRSFSNYVSMLIDKDARA